MIETRPVALEEMSQLEMISSSYRSQDELRLTVRGEEPELAWKLTKVPLRRPVVRVLEGDSVEALAELYGPADQLCFIGAFETGGPAGDHLVGLLTWRIEAWNETAWLCDIRVREEFRQRGIGARLLEDFAWAAARFDVRGIMLETQTSNLHAIRFYLRHGFHLVGLNKAMYGDPGRDKVDTALFLWKSLG